MRWRWAALNGLLGDKLDEPLAIPMAVRRVGEPATPRLAVFLHGLGETEYAWGSPSYGERLHEDLGITPVFIRFNTGRHISENGASLAALLDEVVASWPVEVEQIALIGHSMGGLVARSACHHGGDWTALVRHTVSLGTPHSGAPLEQAVHAMSAALARRARDAPVLALPAPPQRRHPRPAPRLAGRRGLARPGPRRAALPSARRGPAARGRHPLLRRRHHHPQPEAPGRPPARRHARALRRAPRAGASASRRTTASSSAARTTSHCSTTRRSTTACAPGCRVGPCPDSKH